MSDLLRFLIIDGYSKKSRDALEMAGMRLAWKLYASMLNQRRSDAVYDVLLPSDPGVDMPTRDIGSYSGIIWTGCDLCINDTENTSVRNQIEFAKQVYEVGVPSWGSCWGIQMAAVAAGGEVKPNPKGREMGIARKINLKPKALEHPMFEGKPAVFEAFISHDDIVTQTPPGAVILAGNDFTRIQALAVTHKNGTFWAVQYHPEYNLHEIARLIVAREEKLVAAGFFKGPDDLTVLVNRMEELFDNSDRKDLRWQLAIDDDVLSDEVRQCEFVNWINKLVIPFANAR